MRRGIAPEFASRRILVPLSDIWSDGRPDNSEVSVAGSQLALLRRRSSCYHYVHPPNQSNLKEQHVDSHRSLPGRTRRHHPRETPTEASLLPAVVRGETLAGIVAAIHPAIPPARAPLPNLRKRRPFRLP